MDLVHHLRRLLVGVQGRPHRDVGADDAPVPVPLARELCARFRLQDGVSGSHGGFFRVLRIVARRGSRQRRAHPRGIERATLGRRFDHPGRQPHAAVEVFHGVERAHLVRGVVVLVVAPFLLIIILILARFFCERFPVGTPVFLLRLHVVLARPAAGLPVVGLPVPTHGGHPAAPVVFVLVADGFRDFFRRRRRLPRDQQRAELAERRRRGDADGRGQVEEQRERASRGDDDGPAIRRARRVARGSRLELQRQFEKVGVVSGVAVDSHAVPRDVPGVRGRHGRLRGVAAVVHARARGAVHQVQRAHRQNFRVRLFRDGDVNRLCVFLCEARAHATEPPKELPAQAPPLHEGVQHPARAGDDLHGAIVPAAGAQRRGEASRAANQRRAAARPDDEFRDGVDSRGGAVRGQCRRSRLVALAASAA